jgi:hypothetical protein
MVFSSLKAQTIAVILWELFIVFIVPLVGVLFIIFQAQKNQVFNPHGILQGTHCSGFSL